MRNSLCQPEALGTMTTTAYISALLLSMDSTCQFCICDDVNQIAEHFFFLPPFPDYAGAGLMPCTCTTPPLSLNPQPVQVLEAEIGVIIIFD